MEEPSDIGDWKRIAQLGAGGFGIVLLWRNKQTNESIAIKKCKMAMMSSLSPRQRERWKHEVQMMKQMDNVNIVSYKQIPENFLRELNNYNPTKLPLLSMEYCSRGNLRTNLKLLNNMFGLREHEVRFILGDISNAIQYLHEKDITHRDIKPENIVMQVCDERPNKVIYKIIDLGYAKELDGTCSFVGTVSYLAPEIFFTENYTKNVDYWSFGMTVFEIITGKLPFLPEYEPVRRFEHIKNKAEDDICIYIKRNCVMYSKEILLKNWISSTFKKNIENWLRIVLQFNPVRRGTYKNKPVDVINCLKDILAKKIVSVFFVYNLIMFSYEVTEDSTFGDLKSLVSNNQIPINDLVVIHNGQLDFYCDTDKILKCIENVDSTTEFYIFNIKLLINKEKHISFPVDLERLHNSQTIFELEELWKLTVQLFFFLIGEKDVLELFNKSMHALIAFTGYISDTFMSKKLFRKIREDIKYLLTKIECYNSFSEDLLKNNLPTKLVFLNNCQRLLRQSKELVENVNGMTEKFLQLNAANDKISSGSTLAQNALEKNNIDVYIRDTSSILNQLKSAKTNSSGQELLRSNSKAPPIHIGLGSILSRFLKFWHRNVLSNNDLQTIMLLLFNRHKSLKKHYTWCMALDREIYRVSKELDDTHRLMTKGIKRPEKAEVDSLMSITFPNDLYESHFETNSIIAENTDIRYVIQEKFDEANGMLQKVQSEALVLLNGLTKRYSDI